MELTLNVKAPFLLFSVEMVNSAISKKNVIKYITNFRRELDRNQNGGGKMGSYQPLSR